MKKLLFMYPIYIHRYLGSFSLEEMNLLEQTLDMRYREKGYQICFLSFPNIAQDNLRLLQTNDTVIFGSMCFDWNTLKFKGRMGRGDALPYNAFLQYWKDESKRMLSYIDYPSFEKILKQLNPDDKVIVAGVDPYDTPLKFTKYLQEKGYDAMIDLELGKDFPKYSKYYSFSSSTYNPRNLMIHHMAETLYKQGIETYERASFCLEDSVYCTSSYDSTISVIDAYFYKICVDPFLDVSSKDEFLSHLQYLFDRLSLQEKRKFQNQISYFYKRYVKFLYQICMDYDICRFSFVLSLFHDFIEMENSVRFSWFQDNLYTLKKYLLENNGDPSFQTSQFSSEDVKMYFLSSKKR